MTKHPGSSLRKIDRKIMEAKDGKESHATTEESAYEV